MLATSNTMEFMMQGHTKQFLAVGHNFNSINQIWLLEVPLLPFVLHSKMPYAWHSDVI